MKKNPLGDSTANIGDWMRLATLVMLVIAIALPTIKYKPWTKIDIFWSKATTDTKK